MDIPGYVRTLNVMYIECDTALITARGDCHPRDESQSTANAHILRVDSTEDPAFCLV